MEQEKKLAQKRVFTAFGMVAASMLIWVVLARFIFGGSVPDEGYEFVAAYPLLMGICVMVMALVFKRSAESMAFVLPKTRYPLYALSIAPLLSVVPFLVSLFTEQALINGQPVISPTYMLVLFVIYLSMAVAGEMMWRGLLFPNLLKLTSFRTTSIILGLASAAWQAPVVYFSSLLYPAQPFLFSMLMLLVLSVSLSFIFSYLRVASKSVWPSMILQAFYFCLLFLLIQPVESSASPSAAYFKSGLGIFYVTSAVICGLVSYRLYRKFMRSKRRRRKVRDEYLSFYTQPDKTGNFLPDQGAGAQNGSIRIG